ncbi:GNAT family N-acetyltransferase [Paenactinomyces guangxiensis]|uniref:GNAT family N-acetyltransferase n=2 Tax=Paenactinomyces guangxiensis TaxID=1490290 RepID=A0A7W1WS13_9BACL|nr:GNAT family N-acetyltransferase [Paenactinomyces guangxiensis]MBH8591992.1 GNAT family N-acetyltransferase [Paenactinomyces guangxiensis]
MSVRKDWRNKGIGRVLLETLLQWAENHPRIEKVFLEVFVTNEWAIHLYRQMGFVTEGRRVKQVQLHDGEYVDDLIMARFTNKEK